MKKYEKPAILVERFAVSQRISSCGLKLNSLDMICVLNTPGIPEEAMDMAFAGYFTNEGGCIKEGTNGKFCLNTSVGTAVIS